LVKPLEGGHIESKFFKVLPKSEKFLLSVVELFGFRMFSSCALCTIKPLGEGNSQNKGYSRPASDQTLKCSGQARSKGRAPLSKQNLNLTTDTLIIV
jgi:hypothetical protein